MLGESPRPSPSCRGHRDLSLSLSLFLRPPPSTWRPHSRSLHLDDRGESISAGLSLSLLVPKTADRFVCSAGKGKTEPRTNELICRSSWERRVVAAETLKKPPLLPKKRLPSRWFLSNALCIGRCNEPSNDGSTELIWPIRQSLPSVPPYHNTERGVGTVLVSFLCRRTCPSVAFKFHFSPLNASYLFCGFGSFFFFHLCPHQPVNSFVSHLNMCGS